MKAKEKVVNPFLAQRSQRPRRRQPSRFESNQAAAEALVAHIAATRSTAHVRNIRVALDRFVAYLDGESIYDQDPDTLLDYFDNVAMQCGHYRRGGITSNAGWTMPPTCRQKLPLNCATTCPLYEPLKKLSVAKHVIAVKQLYGYLAQLKHLPVNVAQTASDIWWNEHKRLVKKEKAASSDGKRFVTHDEAVRLVDRCPEIKWATYYLVTFRYGLRVSEMARLSASPTYLDPELKWIKVPQARGNDGKRISTKPYPIDEEIRRHLSVYLRWRAAKLERLGLKTTRLFFSKNGQPYPDGIGSAASAINPSLTRIARIAGLDDPDGVTSHVGRRFFTDGAQSRGVHGNELKLVRGDFLQSEATGDYTDPSRLAALWHQASPPIGVRPPRGYYTR